MIIKKNKVAVDKNPVFTYRVVMPKAVTMWLAKYTKLTITQISDFTKVPSSDVYLMRCDLTYHQPLNPVKHNQLTEEEIKRCEDDETASLTGGVNIVMQPCLREKKYISSTKRKDKPAAILWLLKKYPNIEKKKITKLLGTTTKLIEQVLNEKKYEGVVPKNPLDLGLCNEEELSITTGDFSKPYVV